MKLYTKSLSLVALAAVASLPMLATPTLRLSEDNGSTWTTVTDGGGGDNSPVAGVVQFNAALTNWFVNVTTGLTKPAAGTAQLPILDLNSVNLSTTSAGAKSLIMEFSEIGYGLTSNNFGGIMGVGGTLGVTGKASYEAFYGATNTLFDKTDSIATLGQFGTGGAFSGSTNTEIKDLTPYSLTLRSVIAVTGFENVSYNLELRAVPEPGFYGALAIGLSGLFTVVARRRSATKA